MNPNMADEAHKGAKARWSKRTAALDPIVVALPPLDSVENAKKRLAIINDLTVNGTLSGSLAGAAARQIEVWIKADAHEMDRNKIRELTRQLEAVEAELKKPRLRVS